MNIVIITIREVLRASDLRAQGCNECLLQVGQQHITPPKVDRTCGFIGVI